MSAIKFCFEFPLSLSLSSISVCMCVSVLLRCCLLCLLLLLLFLSYFICWHFSVLTWLPFIYDAVVRWERVEFSCMLSYFLHEQWAHSLSYTSDSITHYVFIFHVCWRQCVCNHVWNSNRAFPFWVVCKTEKSRLNAAYRKPDHWWLKVGYFPQKCSTRQTPFPTNNVHTLSFIFSFNLYVPIRCCIFVRCGIFIFFPLFSFHIFFAAKVYTTSALVCFAQQNLLCHPIRSELAYVIARNEVSSIFHALTTHTTWKILFNAYLQILKMQ